jgi:hypothetical protein
MRGYRPLAWGVACVPSCARGIADSKVPKMADKQTQAAKFKQAARDLGCDESEEAFDEKLRVIARQKPKEPSSPRKRKKSKAA